MNITQNICESGHNKSTNEKYRNNYSVADNTESVTACDILSLRLSESFKML